MRLHVVLLSLLTAGLLYWAFRDIDFGQARLALVSADWKWLAPMGVAYLAAHLLRSHRFGLLLGQPVSLRRLVSVNATGYLAAVILPIRLGEFARPYLLRADGIPAGSAFGAVFLERLLDFLMLLLCLVFLASASPMSRALEVGDTDVFAAGGRLLAALLAVGATLLVFLVVVPASWLTAARGFGRSHALDRVVEFAETFQSGTARLLERPRVALVALAESVGVFVFSIAGVALGLAALTDVAQDPLASLSVFTLTSIGMLIAPTPGALGAFEACGVAALIPFGVDRSLAALAALVVHLGQLGFTIGLGLLFAGRDGVDLRGLFSRSELDTVEDSR